MKKTKVVTKRVKIKFGEKASFKGFQTKEVKVKKRKEIEAWAVTYKGKILTDGWGTLQNWVFRTRWLAQDAKNDKNNGPVIDRKELKIVRIGIIIKKV